MIFNGDLDAYAMILGHDSSGLRWSASGPTRSLALNKDTSKSDQIKYQITALFEAARILDNPPPSLRMGIAKLGTSHKTTVSLGTKTYSYNQQSMGECGQTEDDMEDDHYKTPLVLTTSREALALAQEAVREQLKRLRDKIHNTTVLTDSDAIPEKLQDRIDTLFAFAEKKLGGRY